jgi:type IV secretory pathway TrbD component
MRINRTAKVMNRPLTILGAERRLFFVALAAGGAMFNLLHTLAGAILLFVVGLVGAQRATRKDPEILRILFNAAKFRRRYDPMKREDTEIRITQDDAAA